MAGGPTLKPGDGVEEFLLWATHHDGVIEERWRTQFRWNADREEFEKEMTDSLKETNDTIADAVLDWTEKRIAAEARQAFIAGAASLAGTTLALGLGMIYFVLSRPTPPAP